VGEGKRRADAFRALAHAGQPEMTLTKQRRKIHRQRQPRAIIFYRQLDQLAARRAPV
jgi:hypothetical protein